MTETVVYEITGHLGRSGPGNTPTWHLLRWRGLVRQRRGQRLSTHTAPELIVTMIDYLLKDLSLFGGSQSGRGEKPRERLPW